MRRMHLFEFEDLPWFPDVARDAMTAYLSKFMALAGILGPLVPTVVELVRSTGAARVVDLCSGGGGPAAAIAEGLRDAGIDAEVWCTDLYPNAEALAEVASLPGVRAHATPVDATAVPAELGGVRTLFNAFHHFRPELARQILVDAHDQGEPIAVFEVVDRRLANLVGLPAVPLFVALLVPFLRPFRWAWLPLTYLVPIIPLASLWDGFASCMRVYQPNELAELVDGLDEFEWSYGHIAYPGMPVKATYLVGRPRSEG